MANKRVTRAQALADADSIFDFIATDNLPAAANLIHRFERIMDMLTANPEAGRERSDLAPELRSFPVGNYVIFYQPVSEGIEVVRILHAARDITPEDIDPTS
jgi:toxin ParE1/3/4